LRLSKAKPRQVLCDKSCESFQSSLCALGVLCGFILRVFLSSWSKSIESVKSAKPVLSLSNGPAIPLRFGHSTIRILNLWRQPSCASRILVLSEACPEPRRRVEGSCFVLRIYCSRPSQRTRTPKLRAASKRTRMPNLRPHFPPLGLKFSLSATK